MRMFEGQLTKALSPLLFIYRRTVPILKLPIQRVRPQVSFHHFGPISTRMEIEEEQYREAKIDKM